MACTSCKSGVNGMPAGCGNKGHCSTGGCNRLNTFDWLTVLDLGDPNESSFVEVSFKGGARKSFYKCRHAPHFTTGDMVVVDTGNGGYDLGRVSLMGELVTLQMKRKNFSPDRVLYEVLRKANQRDLEKMEAARKLEHAALVKARVIARTLGLEMKIGDVEYQADQKKATFYYTADGWIDFRELVKCYAKEFKIKIEMRQIGARQESARIGGIGSCGRELCCSTWLTDFKSVNTNAARYQNIAINQSKLTGQCGRLKCCLNYELDLYIDELEKYPADVDYLYAKNGKATLVKVDIFKGVLYYSYEPEKGRTLVMPLAPDEVRRIKAMNDAGEKPDDIVATEDVQETTKVDDSRFVDGSGEIELPFEKRKKKKKKAKNKKRDKESSADKPANPAANHENHKDKSNQRQPTTNQTQNQPHHVEQRKGSSKKKKKKFFKNKPNPDLPNSSNTPPQT